MQNYQDILAWWQYLSSSSSLPWPLPLSSSSLVVINSSIESIAVTITRFFAVEYCRAHCKFATDDGIIYCSTCTYTHLCGVSNLFARASSWFSNILHCSASLSDETGFHFPFVVFLLVCHIHSIPLAFFQSFLREWCVVSHSGRKKLHSLRVYNMNFRLIFCSRKRMRTIW